MLAGIARYVGGVSDVLAFVLAAIALAGLAWIVSFATEQLGEHYGPAVTGFMQSTLGNLPEFFVVLFALQARAAGRRPDGDPRLDPGERAARAGAGDRRRRAPRRATG